MTLMRCPCIALIALLLPVGCVVGKSSLGETSPEMMESAEGGEDGEDAEDGEGDPGMESSSGGPGMTSTGTTGGTDPSGTTEDPDPSGTTEDPDPSGTTGGPEGAHHAACADPAPMPMPALPSLNLLPGGEPAFTEWESLACADVAVTEIELCTPACAGGGDVCLHGGTNEGVCTSFDVDIWCDGEGEVAGYGDGCYMCMPSAAHARGCCEFPGTFDCRTWPYEGTSGPSMICATHDDCEAGLVCASPHENDDTGYGLCRCPEDVGTPNDLGEECY